MANKSAARFTPVKGGKDLPSIEEIFDKQKKGMLATIDIQLKQDDRFDTLMAMRQSYERFFADKDSLLLNQAKDLASRVKMQHQKIREFIESMTVEQITAEDFTNPCDALVDFAEPKNWIDVFEQSVFFSAVQPYGQSFDDLHGRMMDEVNKRA